MFEMCAKSAKFTREITALFYYFRANMPTIYNVLIY